MPTVDDERAAEIFGVAISEAVRRAVKDVRPLLAGRADGELIDLTDGPVVAVVDDEEEVLAADPGASDPYAMLGVSSRAPWDEIVAARNRLLRQWHPDAGGDEEQLRRLNAAFAELRVRRAR